MNMEDCSKLIQICCALHNYLKEKNVEFDFEWPPPENATATTTEEAESDSELNDTLPMPDVLDTEQDTATGCNSCGERIPIPIDPKKLPKVPTSQIIMDKYF